MNDLLLNISKSTVAKKLLKTLKLPIPLPQELKRQSGPWTSYPLLAKRILFKSSKYGLHSGNIMEALHNAGAEIIEEVTTEKKTQGIVFDASGIADSDDLHQVYAALNPLMRSVSKCGRIVIIGTTPSSLTSAKASAAQYSLQGFCRSLAKECGKRGTTVQLIYCPKKLDLSSFETPFKFFLSDRSSFITGQTIELDSSKSQSQVAFAQNLSGKRALVTGAAHGIGAAIAKRLSEEGAHVVLLDRPSEQEALQNVADEIGGCAVLCDLLEKDFIKTILKEAGETGFDIVINNAGITRDKKFANLKSDSWDQTIAINLTAAESICTSLLENGLNQAGKIICMSSIAGIAGNVGQTNYATAKSGIIGFVEAMAPLVKERGITINAIAPGFIATRMTENIPIAIREVARRFNSLSQAGTTEDIAELAVLLAHSGSSAINGKTLRVCGQNLIGA